MTIPKATSIATGAPMTRQHEPHDSRAFITLPPPSDEEIERIGVGIEIAQERNRQIMTKGYQPETDDAYVEGELAQAAATYALTAADISGAHAFWPWHQHTFRPGDPRRNLIKAGALIMAEIERLDRAAASGCSCMEVFGEDPACKIHGEGTAWAAANPDIEQ